MTSDPSAASIDSRAARDARLAWVLGGSAFLASVLLPIILTPQVLSGVAYVGSALHVFGLVVFALGVRGSGSATGRRPLATGALLGLAGWTILFFGFGRMVLPELVDGRGVPPQWWMPVTTVDLFLRLALALVVVVQIARHEDVPRPWNRAPLWSLVAMTITAAALQVTAVAAPKADMGLLLLLNDVHGATIVAAYVFLGILAIVLGLRENKPDAVTVYRGSSDPA